MAIKVICVGKNKDTYIKLAISEYLRRITIFSPIELIYLPDATLTKTNNKEIVKQKEGEQIAKAITQIENQPVKRPFIIALDSNGKRVDSLEFALQIENVFRDNEIVFIIGGAYGLDDSVKKSANLLLSLSQLTFTHQLTRIILLEQIYRAYTIIKGKKYHY
jgi:23S rRNA (pseudouridine1915-N3)-methyltransferase